jgi:PAS domain S-box-containing protein
VSAAGNVDADDFRRIVEAAPDGVVMVDASGTIRFANGRMEELFGYDRDDLVGRPVELLLPPERRERHVADRARYVADPHTRPMGIGLDLVARHRDGHEIPVEVSLSPLDSDSTIAIVRDVRARREADAQLRSSEEHVRLLEDRDRIARDLHDHIIQRLFAAGMALEGAVARSNDEDVNDRVSRVVDDLDDTIRQLRSVIFDLQDRGRATSGLRARMLQVIAEARPALGHDPRVRFEGPVDTLGDAVTEHVLAVLREALSNVGRHSGAGSTDVFVAASAHGLVLEVTDDGDGATDAPAAGHGLRNLEERAAELGGSFELGAAPNGGTRLHWQVPLGS